MNFQPNTDYEHSAELREARRQVAAASIKRRYELAEQITGMTIAELVASADRKRKTQLCITKK
jgi:hypothetical protein